MTNLFLKRRIVAMWVVIGIISASPVSAEIVLLPAKFTLTGSEARQTLLVEKLEDGRYAGTLTAGVVLKSSDSKIVKIENNVAIPVANGSAIISVTSEGRKATANVTVEGQERKQVWSFRNHVQSVLTKAGCNSGACHGAASGKNGFKLSLRGYDPDADFRVLTRQARGRRVIPSDPGRSLLLTKPTAAIPHKGGMRFTADSYEYRVLSQWIASGQPGPAEDDPRIVNLEILPTAVVLKPGRNQQMVVRARFSDGHTEDVTRWAKFSSTNLIVAKVGERGKVDVMGHGEGAIVAWYLATNVVATLSVPYENKIDPSVFASAPRNNIVDELVLEKLKDLNVPPSPPASDSVFLRRAYLDTIGMIPTADETRRFLADVSPDKRTRVIDQLLAGPEFVDYWSYKWSDLLLVSGQRLRPDAVNAYYKWIREQVAENTPWDEFTRQVISARGSTLTNGAANFFSLHQDPFDMAETASVAFLGMSINCARCHDHPLEKWTNDDYYGMAGLFARVRGKGWGGDFRRGDGNRSIFTATEGELIQPRTGRPQPPRPLNGKPIPFNSTGDRRIQLAEWMTSPKNAYFTRAIVNRVWANFFGVGIVEKVDDLRLTNPPSNPKLFDGLTGFLVENKYDLKSLMRLILTSAAYQRSSRSLPGNQSDKRFYSRYYPRRLKAEVLLDAISQVSGVPTKFKDERAGTRALQLHDASVASYFLETFGRPKRIITCDCERSDEPSMTQVLNIMNGDMLNSKLETKNNRISKLLAAGAQPESIVDDLYLVALSRYPTPDEKLKILQVLSKSGNDEQRLLIEDLYWSVLSSREFLFNH